MTIVGVLTVCLIGVVEPHDCNQDTAIRYAFPSQADAVDFLPEGAPHTFTANSLPLACFKDTAEWLFSPENTQSPRPFVVDPATEYVGIHCGDVDELIRNYAGDEI